jgi:hypothetical protein
VAIAKREARVKEYEVMEMERTKNAKQGGKGSRRVLFRTLA